ncbi:HlyD family type I secretion periplasmic adaptor subunit [Oceanobacter mangrovi]|uniref:HlyD family type I secretion periplasmic adaptor subunit n=1 Tax=Oceanobacter mangrovi TaxID=2862510 RepID=UPI001C8D4DFF|nr:HlyD family type I secretion periplasmic adaptor subunit [Oceanobacter mangrovi]
MSLPHPQRFSDLDIDTMHSLQSAIAQRVPWHWYGLTAVICLTTTVLLIWAAVAEIDTVVRASGKIVPAGQVQTIQSLEGGVLAEILVSEGQQVSAGQPLAKISDLPFSGSFEENRVQSQALKARLLRLQAEADSQSFEPLENQQGLPATLLTGEQALFNSHRAELNENQNILREQIKQAESQQQETQARIRQLERSLQLINKELALKQPLVARRVLSEVDLLQLQSRQAEAEGELEASQLSLPRLQSLIEENRRKLEHSELEFRSQARQQLTEQSAELARLLEIQTSLADRVARTTLRSPVNGTVKRVYANTPGGVIQPGMDVLDIVPDETSLLVEVKIRPADIGHLSQGQNARIKLTAYDFAIYGGVAGQLEFISADTITEDTGGGESSYFVGRVRPASDAISHAGQTLPIRVGMTSEVDIVTGKRSLLSYLLNPINRTLSSGMLE